MDLGTKQSSPGALAPAQTSEGKDRITYPGLSIYGEAAQKVLDENECDVGETYTAPITFRVRSIRIGDKPEDISLEYDVLDIGETKHVGGKEEEGEENKNEEGTPAEEAGETDEEEKAEEKALGYKRPKANKSKETPDTSAKSLY